MYRQQRGLNEEPLESLPKDDDDEAPQSSSPVPLSVGGEDQETGSSNIQGQKDDAKALRIKEDVEDPEGEVVSSSEPGSKPGVSKLVSPSKEAVSAAAPPESDLAARAVFPPTSGAASKDNEQVPSTAAAAASSVQAGLLAQIFPGRSRSSLEGVLRDCGGDLMRALETCTGKKVSDHQPPVPRHGGGRSGGFAHRRTSGKAASPFASSPSDINGNADSLHAAAAAASARFPLLPPPPSSIPPSLFTPPHQSSSPTSSSLLPPPPPPPPSLLHPALKFPASSSSPSSHKSAFVPTHPYSRLSSSTPAQPASSPTFPGYEHYLSRLAAAESPSPKESSSLPPPPPSLPLPFFPPMYLSHSLSHFMAPLAAAAAAAASSSSSSPLLSPSSSPPASSAAASAKACHTCSSSPISEASSAGRNFQFSSHHHHHPHLQQDLKFPLGEDDISASVVNKIN